MGQWRIVEKQPAHRPSRRNDIVDAAVRIFADKGYAEAAITDIAEAADVAVTAVRKSPDLKFLPQGLWRRTLLSGA